MPQYLGRLAANATTIINAEDYGRAVYDLAMRRQLIDLGEQMVNAAFDSPIDAPPAVQIEEAEQALFELAETGQNGSRLRALRRARSPTPSTWPPTPSRRDGGLSGLTTGLHRPRPAAWAACSRPTSSSSPGAPRWARPRSPPTSPSTSRSRLREAPRDEPETALDGAVVGFFSLEMSAEQLATRILSEQAVLLVRPHPPRRASTSASSTASSRSARSSPTCRSTSTTRRRHHRSPQLAARAPAAEAPARPRSHHRRLPAARCRLGAGAPPKNRVQEMSEITRGLKALAKELAVPVHRAVPALPRGRTARGQAPAAVRPARIRLDRAGRRRGDVRLPRGVLS